MGGSGWHVRRLAMSTLVVVLLLGIRASDAGAAIGLVTNHGAVGNVTAGATSLSLTLAVGAASGNTVIVSFAMDPSAGSVGCSDTEGNTYTVDADVPNGTATTGVRTVVCSSTLATALAAGDQITVSHPGAAARAMSASEFTGMDGPSRLDRTAAATGNSATPGVGPTATTTNPDELLIGTFGVETKKDEPFVTDPLFTALPRENSGNTAGPTSHVTINPAYRIVAATGAYSATGTISPARHWAGIIATYRSSCGDGIVQNGETCDDGGTADGDCCSSTCMFEAAGTVCRGGADVCDAQETCTGSSGTCPADALVVAGTECRASAGVCDPAESCTGADVACPTDAKSNAVCRGTAATCDAVESCDGVGDDCPEDAVIQAGTECRGSGGVCDLVETCDGTSPACPADAKSTAVCRGAAGVCDTAESCDGVANDCPADAVEPPGTSCRPSAGACDSAETCDGSGTACPADVLVAGGTECRGAAGTCDLAESCTGSDATCPADAKSSAECRAAAGTCDVAERCDGAGDDCPADVVVSAGTECRGSAGVCDIAETCDGSGTSCPSDAKSSDSCRAAVDVCDAAESCDGVANDCPPDAAQPAGTGCRAAAGICDVEEVCDGSATACPDDAFRPGTDECRASAGTCDVAERCPGTGIDCPADALRTADELCRPSAGACDAAETCSGSSADCPADALSGPAVTCRVAAGPCDVAEGCNGMDAACPADQIQPASFVCRPSSGACDPEETCSAGSPACPADVGEPDGDDDGVCDSIDACPEQSDPAQADGDADGLGDACDPCSNIVPVFASRSNIRIKGLDTPPGDDQFVFRGQMIVPTTPPIDPATKGIRLLLDDAGANVLDVIVPGGAGWKTSRSGNSWRFKSASGPGGIVKVSLRRRAKAAGNLRFRVLGRAGSLAVTRARIPVKGTLVVDAPMARTGQCGETQYPSAGCEFSRSGRSLRCR